MSQSSPTVWSPPVLQQASSCVLQLLVGSWWSLDVGKHVQVPVVKCDIIGVSILGAHKQVGSGLLR